MAPKTPRVATDSSSSRDNDPVSSLNASIPSISDAPNQPNGDSVQQPRKLAYPLPAQISHSLLTNTESFLRLVTLLLISAAAIGSRLFAVIRFESVIHEFDPWFNYRASKVLVNDGFYEFWNWFDPTAWYPLGRVVGGTIYPGLMVTSGLIWNALRWMNMPVDIRNVCVMLAPGFAGLTAIATYLFTTEMSTPSAGLLAAAFIGIAPGYISRSVAGSYDNEAIAIFLLMSTFYFWIRALKLGSAFWGMLAALFYGWMVAAWGGYVFITNMIPLHAFVLILMGRFTQRLYLSYSSWYIIGTICSMQVPFVGFLPLRTSEHMAALGVFGLLQLVSFVEIVRRLVPGKQFQLLLRGFVVLAFVASFTVLVALTFSGWIAPWTGRFYSLWDTGYAKIHIPIIASVSEHQPTAWPSFFFDLGMLIFFFPAGLYWCFKDMRDEQVFIIIYAVLSSYFAGVMVRLMLVITPVVCVSAAIAYSKILETYIDPIIPQEDTDMDSTTTDGHSTPSKKASKKAAAAASNKPRSLFTGLLGKRSSFGVYGLDTRIIMVGTLSYFLFLWVHHCTFVTQTAYSSPSVVLASRNADGSQAIIDDFREAYYWLRQNTEKDAVVMSWWDYGYQIAGMADRPTLVDNNTWNNTHIATVGKAMSSNEDVAYPILRKHDVDYVLVIFGGLLGYSGDDINKFLWMVRIAQGVWPDEVQEPNYFTPRGEYAVGERATSTMKNSLMYKMSYYRFTELYGGQPAQDRVRGQRIPPGVTLDTLGKLFSKLKKQALSSDTLSPDEAFTSENWIVRIYQVKKEDPLGRDHKAVSAFESGKRLKKSRSAAGGGSKKKTV
ncbi:Oligosaccharyl transferase STT3 subunit-domain-containing protein [Kockovaella imperatae]|uniref:Dolichyl-diphosphooligosaccharide--protein glycosyltransferase subunit STT3 n=1 Tax=Kockovaella imperatae TaxID=4999 RepID=A0A1Y1UN53_9TREE|nr:Oligosaccharyl transferase STT3 subunit-domain-containing protein [Kockovaella imperatae]ORX39432.1 Oligosaccharyl transferase STT3 subunit-domain-containing protein [Kockovaella imperatae]